ncbi:MAG: glycosyltransferase family 4 protein [Lachnospiraceae bacterium]|nr:glycosyltransferase family 4 protein [Lachnospiraceae bacterium]
MTNYANGLYLFRKELLSAFAQDGHEVAALLPPDENADRLRGLCRVIETPFDRRGVNPLKDMGLFLSYLALLKKEKPDVVLTYTVKPNVYGGIACRIRGVPYLCNVTGLGTAIENGGLLSGILLAMYRISMKSARRVFFQNMKNRDFMNKRNIAVHNSALLPGSGVNLLEHPFRDYPTEEKHVRFLAVIRIMKDKGIEEYLEAARIMKKKDKSLKFYLAGEYEEETRSLYEPQIEELSGKKVIKYLGHIDNVEEVMAKSHIIVHPSYHEGLSNVLLEAAACGRPVLASDIGGCMETFSEGESGFGFAVKSADALVQAMEKILALSAEERRQMGIAGRAWVEKNFDRSIIIKAYRNELKEVRTK